MSPRTARHDHATRRRSGPKGLLAAVTALMATALVLPAVASANVVQNGGFTEGLADWPSTVVAEGDFSGYPHISAESGARCDVAETGVPHLQLDVPGGADGYVEQVVRVPAEGGTLKFLTWDDFEATTLKVSAVTGGSPQTLLEFTPPSIEGPQALECSGEPAVMESLDMAAYAGKEIGLRFEATSGGFNGTIDGVTDISLGGETPMASITGEPNVALPESGNEEEDFTVSLSAASSEPVAVAYRTEDGTATVADDDYSQAAGVVEFEPGQTSKQLQVTVDDGDGKDTSALEQYKVSLSDAGTKGAEVSPSAASATGTIGLPGFSGHTLDGKGHPIAGAKLTLTGRPRNGASVTQEITSDAAGAYTIAVDPGEYSIYAHGVPTGQPPGLKWTPGIACPGTPSGAYCEKIFLSSSDGKSASAKVDFAYGEADPEAENLEVLQAVQAKSFDSAGPVITLPDGSKASSFAYNGVALGAASPTIVRLYGANNGAQTAETVNAQLRAYTTNGGTMTELPGGPVAPLDNGLNLLEAPQFPANREKPGNTYNFMVPEAWTTTDGPITLVGTVDPEKSFPECSKCRENDAVAVSGITFTKEKPLQIKPMALTWVDKGKTVAPESPTGAIEKVWPYFPLARNQLVIAPPSAPLDISAAIAAAVAKAAAAKDPVSGDKKSLYSCLANGTCTDVLGPSILGMEIEAVGAQWRQTQQQIGGIPVAIFRGSEYDGTFGETAGVEPGALFATDSAAGNSESLPHEILHALGFKHTAGCGTPASPEAYPANPPEILGYGVNRAQSSVGGIGRIYGAEFKDLMSYCRPRWMSSPTWSRLVSRLATGTLPAPPSSSTASASAVDPSAAATAARAGMATVTAVVIDGQTTIESIGDGRAFGGTKSGLSLQSVGSGGKLTHTVGLASTNIELDSASGSPPLEVLSAEVPTRDLSALRIVRAGHILTRLHLPRKLGLKIIGPRRACLRDGYLTVRYRTSAPLDLIHARLLGGPGSHLKLLVLGGQPNLIHVGRTQLPKRTDRIRLAVSDGVAASSVTLKLSPHC